MEFLGAAFSCLLILMRGCHTARGDYEGVIIDDSLKWLDARQRCLDRHPSCDLSPLNAQQHLTFWNSLALNDGASYWVGARLKERLQWQRSGRPLISEEGCYLKPEGLTTEVRPMKYNGPERCLTQCPGSAVAIQGTACFCLTEEQTSSLVAQRRPLEECHTYCNREAYRCGGDQSRVSVYKIPDRTLYEKRGQPNTFFWLRGHNNDHEFILFTNKPTKQKRQFCVSPTGVYSAAALKGSCPVGGSNALSFEDVDVMTFLEATSAQDDLQLDDFSFRLPLGYVPQLLWLDGEEVGDVKGRGPCMAITYSGQQYTLGRRPCKDKLPFVCSCYTPSPTTISTTPEPTTTSTTA